MTIFLLIVTLAVGIVYWSMILTQDKDKVSDAKRGKKRSKRSVIPLSTYIKMYKIFKNNPLFRREFKQIETRIGELSVYTPQEERVVSTQFYALAQGIFVVVLVLGILVYRDVFVALLIVLYAQVIKNTLIFKQMDNIQYQVLGQLKMAFSSVREKYQIYDTIPDSLNEAEVPKLLVNSFEEIYMILTANNPERRLEDMYASNPYRLVQTFAGICYKLHESGDTRDEKGNSNFLESVAKLNEEVNMEILKATQVKLLFKNLSLLPIIPVFGIGIIQSIITSSVPGISVLYKGTYGYASRLIIILASIIGYEVISKMNSTTSVSRDDVWIITKVLLKKKWFAKIINDIKPIKGERVKLKRKKIKQALSKKSIEHLYAEKLICCFCVFVFFLSASIVTIVAGRSYIYNNYTYKSFTVDEMIDNKELAKRKTFDAQYLSYKTCPTTDATKTMIKEMYPKMNDFDRSDQIDRITSKYISYHDTIYYWWILALVFILSYVGWYIPDYILKKRMEMVKAESEEDVLQLQTMISILMLTSIDTLDVIFWLSKQSRIHKDALAVCFNDYPSDALRAINNLKRSDPENVTFIRMCNKLALTVYQISLKDAFADIEADRSYMLKLREMNAIEAIKSKRNIASYFALAPIVLTSFLCLVFPLGILGWSQYTKSMSEADTM